MTEIDQLAEIERGVPEVFTDCDAKKDELEGMNPGWQVWFVPRMGQPTAWCARPYPQLTEDSPEELSASIAATEARWREDGARSA